MAGGADAWSVPVLHGPSSSDNLTTTLVAWARHKGRDPHAFHLSMMNEGRTLLLRGFDLPLLRDFLRYAEYSSVPALECGTPRALFQPIATAEAASAPASEAPGPSAPGSPTPSEPVPSRPPSLSSSSIQMVLGTAQLLADRATDVHHAERWIDSVLALTDLKPEHVGLLLRLLADPEVDPARLALAESPLLRSEGSSILGVAPQRILETLEAWEKGTSPAGRVSIPPRPKDEAVLQRVQLYERGLESATQRWRDVLARLRASQEKGPIPLQSLLEGAVFINEEEDRVAWVVPHSASAMVKALAAFVFETHRCLLEEAERRAKDAASWVGEARRQTFAALETARRASKVASRLGVEFRWVVLLSTTFDGGDEAGFGLPFGAKPPWEAAATPSPSVAKPTPSTMVVQRKLTSAPPGLIAFAQELDAPLGPWLTRSGVDLSLLQVLPVAPTPPRPVAAAPSTPAPRPKVILPASSRRPAQPPSP